FSAFVFRKYQRAQITPYYKAILRKSPQIIFGFRFYPSPSVKTLNRSMPLIHKGIERFSSTGFVLKAF
ncbi:hypothetical protein, partial [Oribacterium sinus]|uniref:hypothetical protein n=1 Tax=Oribacterium sinus TaxID=237576 RepID=UPI0028D1FD4F